MKAPFRAVPAPVHDPVVRLRLYIARSTPNSDRAEQNLAAALARNGDQSLVVGLEVIDIFKTPKRTITDNVIATPTLVGIAAERMLTLIGDLSDEAKLDGMLRSLLIS